MKTKDRNDLIRAYLLSNPLKRGQAHCYKDVCEKFGVNKDVVKGILRDRGIKEITRTKPVIHPESTPIPHNNVKTEIQTNYETDSISLNATRDYDIKSIDDFVAENGIDLKKYKIVSAKNSTWNNGKNQLYSVSLKLEPRTFTSVVNNIDNYLDSVKSLIQKSVAKTARLKPEGISYNYANDKALFVYISDTHIGAMTETDSLYENVYNAEVFKARVNKVFEEICQLKNLHGRFDKIHICQLGDCIDGMNGQTTRGGHHLPQNLSNKEQFSVYVETMCGLFDDLYMANLSKDLHFISVGDSNHAGDLEVILNRTIEIYLNAKYPTIETKIFDKFIDHIFYKDNCVIFTHGKDSKNMKFGYPLILCDKTQLRINEYIFDRKITSDAIHFIKGDLHQSSVQQGKRFRYKNVSSLYGSSKYIHTNFGNTKASTDIEIISGDGKMVMSYCVYF